MAYHQMIFHYNVISSMQDLEGAQWPAVFRPLTKKIMFLKQN